MDVVDEDEEVTKESYTYLKALKSLICRDVSSYFVKKVVFGEKSKFASTDHVPPVSYRLHKMVSETALRHQFEKVLDLEEWRKQIVLQNRDRIPLNEVQLSGSNTPNEV